MAFTRDNGLKIWKYLSPQLSHALAPYGAKLLAPFYNQSCIWKSFQWKGQNFCNRLGVAGGVDKNARMVGPLFRFGFGFVEIGTVTPKPQGPNPGKILDRDWDQKTLWNKMGFPNSGADLVANQLKNLYPARGPVWINIGKNRHTEIKNATQDYTSVASKLEPFADAVVINISSPNTVNLRELQTPAYLGPLLQAVKKVTTKPILLKLSPDQEPQDFEIAVSEAVNQGVDGIILTNTTTTRSSGNRWPIEGGLSGQPLQSLSLKALQAATQVKAKTNSDFLLVSVGGVLTPQDVECRLEMGADLVQVYSALVFEGFSFARNVSDYFHAQKR